MVELRFDQLTVDVGVLVGTSIGKGIAVYEQLVLFQAALTNVGANNSDKHEDDTEEACADIACLTSFL